LTKRGFLPKIEALDDLNATPVERHEHILS